MRTISQRELRNDSGRILRELQDGEEILVTVNGQPVGVLSLSPPPGTPRRAVSPELRRQMLEELGPLPEDERRGWKRDAADDADDVDDPWERPRGQGE